MRRGRCDVRRVSISGVPDSVFEWAPGEPLRLADVMDLPTEGLSGIWRRPGLIDSTGFAPEFREFVESESRDAFLGAMASTRISWLTSPHQLRWAELKLVQLQTAQQLGIPIPKTLVTNNSAAALGFLAQVHEVIAKPVRYGLLSAGDTPRIAWTSPASRADLAHLSGPPVILQRAVRARAHLRVVTVRECVFITRLVATELDWRSSEANHSNFQPLLPTSEPELALEAQRIARALRVGFTAQDWIESVDGNRYFLEANPNGQWQFLDPLFDGGITDTVATALETLAEAPGGRHD